ncbi:Transcriptional regulator [Hyphomicrobiales bacterium]|nr:Transcriptional regulator [Hyphomicrobiales bacterium]CAH1700193.1 Transcriptional regulator [Hyphomicrobiales bacterium]CAI0343955.1 Transcriptional regulator [Hyphomicrobiales bacterium]
MPQAPDALPECPCAATVATVGEWWSILILRDAMQGFTRFDQFQRSLGIAPNMLARRLKHLTEHGIFERRLYSPRPARYQYVLTGKGRDLFPVVAAMVAWGNRHLAREGASLLLADRVSGRILEPVLVDAESGQPIDATTARAVAGPQASPQMLQRLADIAALNSRSSTE